MPSPASVAVSSHVITTTVNQVAFKCLHFLHLCIKCEFINNGTEFITGSCHILVFSQFKVHESATISRLESATFFKVKVTSWPKNVRYHYPRWIQVTVPYPMYCRIILRLPSCMYCTYVSSFQAFWLKLSMHFFVFHTCYMSFRSCLGVMTRITYCEHCGGPLRNFLSQPVKSPLLANNINLGTWSICVHNLFSTFRLAD
jgi:hypothetical protein